jgi:transposase
MDAHGVLDRIHHALLVQCRQAQGREVCLSAAIIDTQTVKARKRAPAPIRSATTRPRRRRG